MIDEDTKMKTPESYEKDDIDRYLKTVGAYRVAITTGGFGESGHPDRIVCLRGYFISIEVKRAGKEPTARQWTRIKEVQAAGGLALWGTAEKVIAEIKAWLNSISAS